MKLKEIKEVLEAVEDPQSNTRLILANLRNKIFHKTVGEIGL